jgi:hypothetical protein
MDRDRALMAEPGIDGMVRRAAGLAEVSDAVLEPLDDGVWQLRVLAAGISGTALVQAPRLANPSTASGG